MSVSKVLERWTFPVEAALGALTAEEKQFRIVSLNSSGKIELATSASEALFVLEDTPKAGEYGTCVIVGVAKIKVSGAAAIKPGEFVASNNSGEAQKALAGQRALGVAIAEAPKSGYVTVAIHYGAKA